MTALKRRIKLTLSTADNSLVLSDLRIDFNVETMTGYALDRATIEVYNLSYDTIRWLGSGDAVNVLLEVGNAGQTYMETLFEGTMMNIQPVKMYQDHVTTLYCWVSGMESLGKTWNTSIKRTKLRNIIDTLAKEAGYSEVSYAAFPEDELDLLVNSLSETKTIKEVLDYLGQTYSFSYGVTNNVLRINRVQDTVYTLTEVIATLPDITTHKVTENLMRKPASFGVAEANVTYRLDPNIIPSDLLEIPVKGDDAVQRTYNAGELIFFVNGVEQIAVHSLYQILSVTHTGSNFADVWDSEIYGLVYSNERGFDYE